VYEPAGVTTLPDLMTVSNRIGSGLAVRQSS
jgi:hypothetical protein